MSTAPRLAIASVLLLVTLSSPARASDDGSAPAEAAPAEPARSSSGFRAGAGGGVNVTKPFAEIQVGRRFERAELLELYLDWSYDAAISEFAFQTAGVGLRTYFARFGRVELLHQALLGVGLSSGGTTQVPKRELGERLLGAFMTQGVGADVTIVRGLHASLTLSTGYPVWLRPELVAYYRF